MRPSRPPALLAIGSLLFATACSSAAPAPPATQPPAPTAAAKPTAAPAASPAASVSPAISLAASPSAVIALSPSPVVSVSPTAARTATTVASPAATAATPSAAGTVGSAATSAANVASTAVGASPVRIVGIQPSPTDSVLTLQNSSSSQADLTGWSLRVGTTTVKLPANTVVPPNGTIMLHSGSGTSAGSDVYLGQDTATLLSALQSATSVALLDANGTVVGEMAAPR